MIIMHFGGGDIIKQWHHFKYCPEKIQLVQCMWLLFTSSVCVYISSVYYHLSVYLVYITTSGVYHLPVGSLDMLSYHQ